VDLVGNERTRDLQRFLAAFDNKHTLAIEGRRIFFPEERWKELNQELRAFWQ
jgi:hypothetical protein